MRRRPHRLRGNGEERRDVVERPGAARHRSPGDEDDERKKRTHHRPRSHKRGLHRHEHGKRGQEERRGVVRPGGRARKGPRKPAGDQRRDEIEDREEGREADRDEALTGSHVQVENPARRPHRDPRRHDEHRGQGTNRVQQALPTGERDREQTSVDQEQESKKKPGTRSEGGHGCDVEGEQERRDRRHERGPLHAQPLLVVPACSCASENHEPGDRGQRKQQEDPHRQRHAAGVQELEDPAPLINRRQDERQRREYRPAFGVSDLREPDVQQEQIRKQRDGPVLAGREERRRRKPTEESQHRDEERLASDRKEHREECDQREQTKRDDRRDEVPQRVRREERREEDRYRRRVHGVGRHRVSPRGFHLADDEQGDRDQNADGHADRRLQQSCLDRIASGRARPLPRARHPQPAQTASRRSNPPSRTEAPEARSAAAGLAVAGGGGSFGGWTGTSDVTERAAVGACAARGCGGAGGGGAGNGRSTRTRFGNRAQRRWRRCGYSRRGRHWQRGHRGNGRCRGRRRTRRNRKRRWTSRRGSGLRADGRRRRRRLRRGRFAHESAHAGAELGELPLLRLDHELERLDLPVGPARRHPCHDWQHDRDGQQDQREDQNLCHWFNWGPREGPPGLYSLVAGVLSSYTEPMSLVSSLYSLTPHVTHQRGEKP